MLDQAKEYLIRLSNKDYTFFTLSGKTEIGKTFLSGEIRRFIKENSKYFQFDFLKEGDTFIWYKTLNEFVSDCLDSGKNLQLIKKCGILFIEEFLSDDYSVINNWNSIVISKAFEILNLRTGKPIVLDTNKSIKDIEKIDVRIHSRLFRNNGVVLDIPNNTTPYLSRK